MEKDSNLYPQHWRRGSTLCLRDGGLHYAIPVYLHLMWFPVSQSLAYKHKTETVFLCKTRGLTTRQTHTPGRKWIWLWDIPYQGISTHTHTHTHINYLWD